VSDPAIDAAYAKPLSKVLQAVASRRAVLFLGSGFSRSAIGLDDKPLPVADALAKQIGKLGKFDAEGDLRYAADRFLGDGGSEQTLIDALQESFTIKSIAPHHVSIASAPWRRIYTTNYDDCLELAAKQAGRLVHGVDTTAKPSDYGAKNNVCVHLNGSLTSLSADSLEGAFKLTTSSYLSPDSFLTSQWFYPFKRDLDFCSAIVFVGYSMYDIEVQRILHTTPEYAGKTFFVEQELRGGKAQFTLERFGTILPIGAESFGNEITNAFTQFEEEPESLVLASLEEYEVRANPVEIRDKDVDAFLMRGDLDDALMDATISGTTGAPVLIPRDELARALELARAGSDLIVTGDFGNGKSIFLRALRSRLSLEGFRVFSADQADAYQSEDLEQLVKKGVKGFLLIDAYEQNLDLVMTYVELAPKNLRLIAGARTSVHERLREKFVSAGLRPTEISVDELSDEEVDKFIDIVDNIGYWGDRAGLSRARKRSAVAHDHHRRLSLNLLALFSAPQIVGRIKELVADGLSVPTRRDTIFSIALLEANDMPLNSSLIAAIAMNNEVYSAEFRNDSKLRQVYRFDGPRVVGKSSLFGLALISQVFASTYIVDQLLKIVASIGNEHGDVREKRDLQRNLFRFSVVERLLPKKQLMQNLVRYYEKLKQEVPWLKSDPHFWLQYGMAQLTHKNYDTAQSYFTQAYAIAAKKVEYHTAHIDNQQARLYLLRGLTSSDAATSFKFFSDAHRLLSSAPEDQHKYRQIEAYREVHAQKYDSFSKANKVQFEHACRAVLDSLTRTLKENGVAFGWRSATRLAEDLQGIVNAIKGSRHQYH